MHLLYAMPDILRQELRKEADFETNDRIHLHYEGSEKIKKAFTQNSEYIKTERLSLNMSDSVADDVSSKEVKLNGEMVMLGLKK